MPIYIVRWPREEAALIRAKNEEHLCDILDEIADPGCARWAVYNGPLWVDFDLPMKPWQGDGADVEVDVQAVADGIEEGASVPFKVDRGGGETAGAMIDAVTAWAVPHVHAVVQAWNKTDVDDPERNASIWMEKLTKALEMERADMDELYRKRIAEVERTVDPQTQALMKRVGLTVEPTWVTGPVGKRNGK